MRALLLVMLAGVTLASPASGKEPVSATICGAGGCRTVEQFPDSLTSVSRTAIAAAGGPHYQVTVALSRGATWTVAYFPEARAIRHVSAAGLPLYTLVDVRTRNFLAGATRGLAPFDARPGPAGSDWAIVVGSLAVALASVTGAVLLSRRHRPTSLSRRR